MRSRCDRATPESVSSKRHLLIEATRSYAGDHENESVYTEAKKGTSWKQKLKQTIDRLVITAKDYDEFLKLMQEAGYEIKTGKYISFRAAGQERFTRAKTIGENYTEERIKERIAGRNPRKRRMQIERKGISLIIDIQNSIKAKESKGYEHWAKINNLKEAAKTLNYQRSGAR